MLQFILTFLFMPESAYHRTGALNIDTGDKAVMLDTDEKTNPQHYEQTNAQNGSSTEAKKPWTRELLPYDGYIHHISFWRTLIRPFFMLGSPIVLWATLLFTTCVGILPSFARRVHSLVVPEVEPMFRALPSTYG